ncbi:hypothetical protein [Streptomyces sp. URMC 123]|uniref:hypothetical protein n=1 Tax=Streptomyces sp. URMC 123 TaxID=3423403 RepID=UPI003F1CA992
MDHQQKDPRQKDPGAQRIPAAAAVGALPHAELSGAYWLDSPAYLPITCSLACGRHRGHEQPLPPVTGLRAATV